nr:MAG TPA: hypothetical protein [Caudoviricetes sp.]
MSLLYLRFIFLRRCANSDLTLEIVLSSVDGKVILIK